MAKHTFSFEKLEVWKEAIELAKDIYELCKTIPKSEEYGLISQLKRATVSISSNIAEGTSRNTVKDKVHFITISYSSTMEVLNLLIINKELNFISETEFENLKDRIYKITNMLNALKKHLLNN